MKIEGNDSPEIPLVDEFDLGLKKSRPLLLWLSCLVCVYFAFEAAHFIFSRFAHPLVIWVLLINFANATSLIALRKVAIPLALLRVVVSVALLSYDLVINGSRFFSLNYINELLSDNTLLMATLEADLRSMFTVWLLVYSISLSRNGYLR